MLRGDIPGVEEWKKSILEYKAASISLGVLDDDGRGSVPNSPYVQTQQTDTVTVGGTTESTSSNESTSSWNTCSMLKLFPGIKRRANTGFRLNALYQPDSPDGFDTATTSQAADPVPHLSRFP